MTIANKGEAGDLLKSARTPKAKAVELHETSMSADGVMQMRKVEDPVPIEAGASLVLKPGGMHLMLLGLEDALKAGENLILTLDFDKAGVDRSGGAGCRECTERQSLARSAVDDALGQRSLEIGETAEMQQPRLRSRRASPARRSEWSISPNDLARLTGTALERDIEHRLRAVPPVNGRVIS